MWFEVLENCVHLFGPFFSGSNIDCYIEPEITEAFRVSTLLKGNSYILGHFLLIEFSDKIKKISYLEMF